MKYVSVVNCGGLASLAKSYRGLGKLNQPAWGHSSQRHPALLMAVPHPQSLRQNSADMFW